jgi:hypothetical protein
MMIIITPEVALDTLREVVAEAGEDYTYPPAMKGEACTYVAGGKPSCLIGRVLFKLGVPLERLEEADRAQGGTGEPAFELLGTLKGEGVVDVDLDVRHLFSEAQFAQDNGSCWGSALAAATTEFGYH